MTYRDLGYNAFLQRTILSRPKWSPTEARNNIPVGSISASSIIPPMNATTDIVFSSVDNNTAQWTSGKIYFANGTDSGTIDAGNTGDISATTYVYYDREKLGTLQTTTNVANATGLNKLLVAIVEQGAAGKDCKITPIIAAGLNVTGITADQIAAGTITANEIAANTITANEIAANTITANEIAAGTITSSEISAGAVTADKISVTNLAAISADLGVVNIGGASNGSGVLNIKDGSGNIIIKGDNAGHHYYDTGGTELIRVDSDGLKAYGTGGNTIKFYDQAGGTYYGSLGYSSSVSAVFLSSGSNTDIYLSATNSLMGVADDSIWIEADNDDNGSGNLVLLGENVLLRSKGSNNSFYLYDGSAYKQILIDDSGGTTRIQRAGSAAKTAIVPTSKGYKALYCTESPEVWFVDFCETMEDIDPLFLEVTEGPYKFIKCVDGSYQVWGKRKGFSGKRFESKTKEEFERNNVFWNTPNTAKSKRVSLKNHRNKKREYIDLIVD